MLAAYIWHFWLGLIMFFAGVLATIFLTIGYLRQVTSNRYPGGRRAREQEL